MQAGPGRGRGRGGGWLVHRGRDGGDCMAGNGKESVLLRQWTLYLGELLKFHTMASISKQH